MFTKNDYIYYFNELEVFLKKRIIIYTDLLNELDNRSVKNKLHAMAMEDMDAFRFVKIQKKNLTKVRP